MMKLFDTQLIVPLLVLLLSYLFLDPFMVLMPTAAVNALIVVFFLLYISFALLLWKEKASDEREEVHRAYAARVAYLTGTGVLVIGIIYQALVIHTVDPWLILTLTVMVFAKYFALKHAESTN